PAARDPRRRANSDRYSRALARFLGEIRDEHGFATPLDGHRGAPRRMQPHQVIIGTRHGATCAPALTEAVRAVFTRHGFEVHENVSGYTGGNIVATAGQPATRQVHALQIEINSALLVTVTWEE